MEGSALNKADADRGAEIGPLCRKTQGLSKAWAEAGKVKTLILYIVPAAWRIGRGMATEDGATAGECFSGVIRPFRSGALGLMGPLWADCDSNVGRTVVCIIRFLQP